MKLMLAEDEPGLSRALTAILQHSDYEVDTALDGLTRSNICSPTTMTPQFWTS